MDSNHDRKHYGLTEPTWNEFSESHKLVWKLILYSAAGIATLLLPAPLGAIGSALLKLIVGIFVFLYIELNRYGSRFSERHFTSFTAVALAIGIIGFVSVPILLLAPPIMEFSQSLIRAALSSAEMHPHPNRHMLGIITLLILIIALTVPIFVFVRHMIAAKSWASIRLDVAKLFQRTQGVSSNPWALYGLETLVVSVSISYMYWLLSQVAAMQKLLLT